MAKVTVPVVLFLFRLHFPFLKYIILYTHNIRNRITVRDVHGVVVLDNGLSTTAKEAYYSSKGSDDKAECWFTCRFWYIVMYIGYISFIYIAEDAYAYRLYDLFFFVPPWNSFFCSFFPEQLYGVSHFSGRRCIRVVRNGWLFRDRWHRDVHNVYTHTSLKWGLYTAFIVTISITICPQEKRDSLNPIHRFRRVQKIRWSCCIFSLYIKLNVIVLRSHSAEIFIDKMPTLRLIWKPPAYWQWPSQKMIYSCRTNRDVWCERDLIERPCLVVTIYIISFCICFPLRHCWCI